MTDKPMTVFDLIRLLTNFNPDKSIYYQVCQTSSLSSFDVVEEDCVKFMYPIEQLFVPRKLKKNYVIIRPSVDKPRHDYIIENI